MSALYALKAAFDMQDDSIPMAVWVSGETAMRWVNR